MFITPDSTEILFKSCRNLPDVQISTVGTMSAYDIFAADVVLFTQAAFAKLVQRWEVGDSEMESEGQSE